MDLAQSDNVTSVVVTTGTDWIAIAALVIAAMALIATSWQIARAEGSTPAAGFMVRRNRLASDDEYEYWIVEIWPNGPAVLHNVQLILVGGAFIAPAPDLRQQMNCDSEPLVAVIRVKHGASAQVGLAWLESSFIGHHPIGRAALRELDSEDGETAYKVWKWGPRQPGNPKKIQSWGRWVGVNRGVTRSKGGFPDKAGIVPVEAAHVVPRALFEYTLQPEAEFSFPPHVHEYFEKLDQESEPQTDFSET